MPPVSGEPLTAARLQPQQSGTDVLLQAVSAVDENVVWASGHGGTWLRTLDGGSTWSAHVMPGVDSLQFRDVHALDADRAWLLSSGPGELSRIYRTVDGGATWRLQFVNPEPEGFYDCLVFRDERHGLAYGDAVDGELRILRTTDGGTSWRMTRTAAVPPAQPGEGGFAASGTCVALGPSGRAWIGTGSADTARLLLTLDDGRSWRAVATPIPGGETAGIFSVAFRDSAHGAVFGGDLARVNDETDNVALTDDGGLTWRMVGRPGFRGAVYGGSYVPGAPAATLVAVGPGGAAWSPDEGVTWLAADSASYWALDIVSPDAGWLVGPAGRVVHISFQ
jgi:photosystem II stability/assembly factor-like uncharacterized protein